VAPAGVESVLLRIACQLELYKPVGGCSFERKLSEICTMRSAQQMHFSDIFGIGGFPMPLYASVICLLSLPFRGETLKSNDPVLVHKPEKRNK